MPRLPKGIAKPAAKAYGKAFTAALDSLAAATQQTVDGDITTGAQASARLTRDTQRLRAQLDAQAAGLASQAIGRAAEHGRTYARRHTGTTTPEQAARPAWARDLEQRYNHGNAHLTVQVPAAYHKAVTAARLADVDAAQRVLDQTADRGLTAIPDRHGRKFGLRAYAVVETTLAANRAMLDTITQEYQAAGVDLVWFTGKGSVHAACARWEGKILALTGPPGPRTVTVDGHTVQVAGTVAEVRAGGAWHPHCGHGLQPWRPGVEPEHPDQRHEPPSPVEVQAAAANALLDKWHTRSRVAITPTAKATARRKVRDARTAVAAANAKRDAARAARERGARKRR